MSQDGAALGFRPADAADGPFVHALRNDPQSRAMSRATGEIDLAAHLAWFERSLADPRRLFLIATEQSEPVGYVRFDQVEGSWEVAIALAPRCRGRGLGMRILAAGIGTFLDARGPLRLTAAVRPENQASRRIFERAGFAECGRQGDFLLFARQAGA